MPSHLTSALLTPSPTRYHAMADLTGLKLTGTEKSLFSLLAYSYLSFSTVDFCIETRKKHLSTCTRSQVLILGSSALALFSTYKLFRTLWRLM